ncbi:MAG: LacI family DNA-binding transcriptional regulator [Christensenellaceae bacterium]|jgi:DNA-binding LacI/PurR family transcriptional regulator
MKKDPGKQLNIRQIAELCGISIATVSRAMNHPGRVSKKTQEKIDKVIKEYGYVPNELAKQLISKKTKTIALFTYDIVNPYFAHIIQYVNTLAFDHDYMLIICDSHQSIEREEKYLQYLMGIRISGILFTEGKLHTRVSDVARRVPCVSIDRKFEVDGQGIPRVTSDNHAGGVMATEYLLSLGHKRIGFCGLQDVSTSEERYRGYVDAMKKNGAEVDEKLTFRSGEMNTVFGRDAVDYYMGLVERPTALLCSNDLIAEGIIRGAEEKNVSIPEELSVVGFDGLLSVPFGKTLTTIKQDVEGIAKNALDKLLLQIDGKEETDGDIILPVRLVKGDTVAACKQEVNVNLE